MPFLLLFGNGWVKVGLVIYSFETGLDCVLLCRVFERKVSWVKINKTDAKVEV